MEGSYLPNRINHLVVDLYRPLQQPDKREWTPLI